MIVWELTDSNLPRDFWNIRDVFLGLSRQPSESLHDYLTRKGLTCGCKACRERRKEEAINKQEILL